MRRRIFLATLAALPPAHAETPAEQASRELQQGIREDRAAEAAGPEAPRPPSPNPATRAIDADRRSIAPSVGRPEGTAAPITGGERAATGGGSNPQR
ncbi:hypothetical protein ACFQS7_20610 [Dankookia sp. GCM10030260]|uniref:hypothetical protein n=1 Tax=Dankookia sp. GCM10030260 TaxID=3273390 RepID=UPI00361D475B